MDILANYGTVLIIIAALFGFLMAIGIGANDVANAWEPLWVLKRLPLNKR